MWTRQEGGQYDYAGDTRYVHYRLRLENATVHVESNRFGYGLAILAKNEGGFVVDSSYHKGEPAKKLYECLERRNKEVPVENNESALVLENLLMALE